MEYVSNSIRDKKLFLLDIDGTISCDNILYQGTMDFLQAVLENNAKYIFITNNSTKSVRDYMKKFKALGVTVDESSFLTSSYVTALYLKEHYSGQLIYALGTVSFIEELKSFQLQITEQLEDHITAAVVGFDNELNYKKIETICELLQTKEVDYIATNPDLICPVEYGFIPDCGAICQLIETAVKRKPIFIGKPNPFVVQLAMNQTGFSKEETIVIGDRLYTDIACGINGEVDTLVVFTGEAKKEDLETSEFQPTYYCETIREIYSQMVK